MINYQVSYKRRSKLWFVQFLLTFSLKFTYWGNLCLLFLFQRKNLRLYGISFILDMSLRRVVLIFRWLYFLNVLSFQFFWLGEFFSNWSINLHDFISFLDVKFRQKRYLRHSFSFTSVNHNINFLLNIIFWNIIQRCVQFIVSSFWLLFQPDYVLDWFLFVGFVNLLKVFMWKINVVWEGFGFFRLTLL